MTLREQIIKLANQQPNLRKHLVPVLRKTAETFEEAIEGKTFRNPGSGNQVQFKSLPPEEQAKLRDAWKNRDKKEDKAPPATKKVEEKPEGKGPEPEKKEAPKQSLKERLTSFLSKAKKEIADAIHKAPEEVHKVVADSEHRAKVVSALASKAKAAPKGLLKRIFEGAKGELKDIQHAAKAAKKLFKKPPGPFSKEDKKAFYSAGAYVAGTILAALPPAGTAIAAATALGHSFAMHVGIATVHSLLNTGFLHYEWAETLMQGIHHITAAEKNEEEIFLEAMTKAVGETLSKGISDDEMKKILAGVELPEE